MVRDPSVLKKCGECTRARRENAERLADGKRRQEKGEQRWQICADRPPQSDVVKLLEHLAGHSLKNQLSPEFSQKTWVLSEVPEPV